jgi:catechol 2,3-dioxygenase-like lactoylglutathione lyase family enzyme
MIDHINALVLPVRDIERGASFYRDKLGFNPDQIQDDEAYLTIGGKGGIVLALFSIDLVARTISRRNGSDPGKRAYTGPTAWSSLKTWTGNTRS